MPANSNASSAPPASHHVHGMERFGVGAVAGEACVVAAEGAGGALTATVAGAWPDGNAAGKVLVADFAAGADA